MADGFSEISRQTGMHIITSKISEQKVFDMQKVIDLEIYAETAVHNFKDILPVIIPQLKNNPNLL